MKVLIAGASGFLGAHLAAAFARAGFEVLAGHRAGSNTWRLTTLGGTSPQLRLVACDFDQPAALRVLLAAERPEIIVNAAAYGVNYGEQDPDRAIACNITALVRLIDAAAALPGTRVIHLGSGLEYGRQAGVISETTVPAPVSLYGATKAAGTLLALARATTAGVPACVLRPFSLYGPLEGSHKFVPQVFAAARSGQALACSPGDQRRDYCYVGDAAGAVIQTATQARFPAGHTVNLGSGTPLSLRELGEAALDAAGAPRRLIQWGAKPHRPDEVMDIAVDPRQARGLLGWHASTSLTAGLGETWRFETLRSATVGAGSV